MIRSIQVFKTALFVSFGLFQIPSCDGDVVLSAGTINFNEAGFLAAFGTPANSSNAFSNANGRIVSEASGTPTSRVVSVDLWNNATGMLHGVGQSDNADIEFSFSTNLLPRAAGSGVTGTSLGPNNDDLAVRFERTGGGNHRFTSNRAFNSANDVGDVWQTSLTMRFADTLTFTAADLRDFSFTSLNTAGSSGWEYSYVGFLDENGDFFSPEPVETWNGSQVTAADGWMLANDRGTIVANTGTYPNITATSNGANGSLNDVTFNPDSLNGINTTTRITGLVWNSYQEAIHDTGGSPTYISSFSSFEVTGGTIATVPEPSSVIFLAGIVGGGVWIRLRRVRRTS